MCENAPIVWCQPYPNSESDRNSCGPCPNPTLTPLLQKKEREKLPVHLANVFRRESIGLFHFCCETSQFNPFVVQFCQFSQMFVVIFREVCLILLFEVTLHVYRNDA